MFLLHSSIAAMLTLRPKESEPSMVEHDAQWSKVPSMSKDIGSTPSMKRIVASAALACSIAGANLLAACTHATTAKHVQSIPVQTTMIARGDISTDESLDGHVTPFFQSNLATQQAASLVAIYANEGDHVHEGEVLAKLDDTPLRAQLTEAQGNHVQAIAHLAQSTIQEPITAQTQTSALTQAQASLQQATQQLLTDRAVIDQSKLTADADMKLLGQGYVAETTYRQANAAYVASLQTLHIDQEKVDQAKAALTVAQRNMLNVPLQQQVIAADRAAVITAAGGEQLLSTQIGQTTLIAPYDGVVTARLLDPGAYASQSQPIFSLAKIDPVYIDFTIHDTDLAYTHPGTPVTFTSPSIPGRTYHATIASINAVPIDNTLVYHTRLIVPNHDEALRGGMLINIKLITAHHTQVLLAPRSAVTQGEDGAEIIIVLDEHGQKLAHIEKVKTGLQSNEQIEISSPNIRAGTLIVAARPDNLAEHSPLQVSEQHH